jgi:transcriptional regulator with XRE-family HTH domain
VIRAAREQHALTLPQVAKRTRLSVSYLSQIERNLLKGERVLLARRVRSARPRP